MWTWLQENHAAIQIIVSLVTTAVWIGYLHVFLVSFLRQTRSGLLINRAGHDGQRARCIVSNLGSEPAYLTDVLAEVDIGEDSITASVVDRFEVKEGGQEGVTAQGPMASGGYVDIGSFDDIFERVRTRFGKNAMGEDVKGIKLIAIAATSQARSLVAAYRNFDLDHTEAGAVILRPVEVEARQVRSWLEQRRLEALLRRIQRGEDLERSPTAFLLSQRFEVPWPWKRAMR